ncbi:uncharacterized protein LOC122957806 isoform X2 [Acropora millepora]|uniref:uncharacterized protein LOC122957806 isoform X2 n=1 Tax=Acropora millepora TaxID=45264 RepID=UPI001CF16A97|nr:uncharacterized protein LOC122957806 isoform X2 [Acropora millepora]
MQLTCGFQDFMMSIHHQTGNSLGNRPINAALRPSICRSIDRSRTPGSTNVTLHVLLGLQRSCESYLARRGITLWLDLIKAFLHRRVIHYVCSSVDCLLSGNGMEFSHNHPSFAYSRVTLQLRLGKTVFPRSLRQLLKTATESNKESTTERRAQSLFFPKKQPPPITTFKSRDHLSNR